MRVVPSIHRVLAQIGAELETELSPETTELFHATPTPPTPNPDGATTLPFPVHTCEPGFAAVFVCACAHAPV